MSNHKLLDLVSVGKGGYAAKIGEKHIAMKVAHPEDVELFKYVFAPLLDNGDILKLHVVPASFVDTSGEVIYYNRFYLIEGEDDAQCRCELCVARLEDKALFKYLVKTCLG